ncbi:MAG: heme-binding protein [Planctomycetota bacterium]
MLTRLSLGSIACLALLSGCVADGDSATPAMQETASASSVEAPPLGKIYTVRQGADPVIQVGERFTNGDCVVRESLPVGYPRPTAVGSIEIKTYPSVRRAEITGTGGPDRGTTMGFWPLFQHISTRDIAMTTPVEMDLPGWSAEDESAPEQWTMSFLYRTPDLGDTGRDGMIVIRDTDPVTVLAIGVKGSYTTQNFTTPMRELEAWLAESGDWEQAGAPRWFGYNGPSVPVGLRWSEVQIPIQPVSAAVAERE